MNPAAVLIDVGGTLWPDRWPSSVATLYQNRLKRALPRRSSEKIERLLYELHARDPGASNNLPLTQDTRHALIGALLAAGFDTADADDVLDAMDLPAKDVIEPFSGADQLLQTVKALGLECVLISNATYRSSKAYRRDFDSFSLGALIDRIVSSVDLGYRKPHEVFFQTGASEANVSPQLCTVIGDSEEKDIVPASRLGMRTIRVAIEVPPPSDTSAD